MRSERFDSVAEMVKSLDGDESLIQAAVDRISSRQIISTLIALRIQSDVSQSDVAENLGCSQSRISKLENGTDEELRIRDIHAYAALADKAVHFTFREGDMSLMHVVKHHAFQISECLQKVCEISSGDETMERGAVLTHIETLVNMARLIAQSAAKLPCLESELKRLAGTTEGVCDNCDDDDSDVPALHLVGETPLLA